MDGLYNGNGTTVGCGYHLVPWGLDKFEEPRNDGRGVSSVPRTQSKDICTP
jgi:hypothetical protein